MIPAAWLGAVPEEGGTSFAVWSAHASAIAVSLFAADGISEIGRFSLEPGDDGVHRGRAPGVAPGALYGLRADGRFDPEQGYFFDPDKLLVDPYAVDLDRPFVYHPLLTAPRGAGGDTAALVPKAVVTALPPPVPHHHPRFPPGGLIYELSVRALTQRHPEVPPEIQGTVAALAHPAVLAHLGKINVDAVELLPIAAWIDERHLPPLGLSNAWGYNPIGFMAPDPRLAPGGLAELRQTVAALHEVGIAVILDVVFNHSGEGDVKGPILSLRGLDSRSYYRHGSSGQLINDSGCGNMLDCDNPAVRRLILDSLRHFVANAGIDGFRFDLATILGRGKAGFNADAPLLQEIADDPLLSDRLLIAEPWDIGPGGYQLGRFPANFLEWNDRYRDDLRRFWRGDSGMAGALATRLSGSSDIFAAGQTGATRSVNFITAHDGFTLADLVSFQHKHNQANGEENRDGTSENISWNHGVEGPSLDPAIAAARRADRKALLASLFASRGAIMLTAGDEFGRSQGGNNNAYCQDNELVWLAWAGRDGVLEDYVAWLSRLRRQHRALRDPTFLGAMDVAWLTADGRPCSATDWQTSDMNQLLMRHFGRDAAGIAVLFNRALEPAVFTLPPGYWRDAEDGSVLTDRVTLAPRRVGFLLEGDRETETLDRLAELAGIEAGWWDFFGHYRRVPAPTKRAFLQAMGFAVESETALARSLAALEARPWRRWLGPVMVWTCQEDPPVIDLTLADDELDQFFQWRLVEEQGGGQQGGWWPRQLREIGQRQIGDSLYRRYQFRLDAPPGMGVHRLILAVKGGVEQSLTLVAAPARAWQPAAMTAGDRLWGYATQLYALRSARNWGIGDFTDLAMLVRQATLQGASAIGINPLHAPSLNRPDRISPYYPSSRGALNVVYIDVDSVADFAECERAGALFQSTGFQQRLAAARHASQVDYDSVIALKRSVLELCWEWFSAVHLPPADSPRGAAFLAFQQNAGPAVARHALFEALAEAMLVETGSADWRDWPAELRDPDSAAVAAFAGANGHRIGFFAYLQWLADAQLAAVASLCRDASMAVGLYRDLGVGIANDGAESWANQAVLCLGASVGAPPDPLNLAGQNWGLVPFNPVTLREAAYLPLLQLLQANMRHAGAIRLDHVMGLQRLYWIPPGARADQGAYVSYPVDEMLALVRLASVRMGCLVIGEDMGTVPDGFRPRMAAAGLLGYRILAFDIAMIGAAPVWRPTEPALVTFGTHDLPSLAGWWQGIDIDSRLRLGLYPEPEMATRDLQARADDRHRLLALLTGAGLLAADFPADPGVDVALLASLASAVYSYMRRSTGRLMMVQLEDVLALPLQMNLPGTVDEHPNWRLRYPASVEQMLADPLLLRFLDTLSRADGGTDR